MEYWSAVQWSHAVVLLNWSSSCSESFQGTYCQFVPKLHGLGHLFNILSQALGFLLYIKLLILSFIWLFVRNK